MKNSVSITMNAEDTLILLVMSHQPMALAHTGAGRTRALVDAAIEVSQNLRPQLPHPHSELAPTSQLFLLPPPAVLSRNRTLAHE